MNGPENISDPAVARRIMRLRCMDRECVARMLALAAHGWGKNEATRRQLDDFLSFALADLPRPNDEMEALLAGAWEVVFRRGWLEVSGAKIFLSEVGHQELVEGIPPDSYDKPRTLIECARIFDVHPNTFSSWVSKEKLDVKRLGRRYRIALKDLPRKTLNSPQRLISGR